MHIRAHIRAHTQRLQSCICTERMRAHACTQACKPAYTEMQCMCTKQELDFTNSSSGDIQNNMSKLLQTDLDRPMAISRPSLRSDVKHTTHLQMNATQGLTSFLFGAVPFKFTTLAGLTGTGAPQITEGQKQKGTDTMGMGTLL